MKQLVDAVKILFPDLAGLKETTIEFYGNVVGYESIFYTRNGHAIGGGISEDKELARRIAVAETLERGLFRKLSNDKVLRPIFHLDQIDSTLGFACGFEKEKTAYRSYCEALEKWALSKVIDENFGVDEVSPALSNLAKTFIKEFRDQFFYQKKFLLKMPFDINPIELVFTLFVGCTEQGAFPGSAVTSNVDDQFTHAVCEAWRNFQNFKLNDGNETNILDRRLNYFGIHKQAGLNQVLKSQQKDWPNPEVELFQEYQTKIENVYLFRTLMKDFIPVSSGPVDRFVI